MIRNALCMLLASGLLAGADFARTQMPVQKIAGTIVKLEGLELEVTMTNATIAGVGGGNAPRGTMTNATVAEASATAHGRRLTLTYKGGEKTAIVPGGVAITTVEPSDRSLLVPGAHVVVYAATGPDGSLAADRLSVGKNGFVPAL